MIKKTVFEKGLNLLLAGGLLLTAVTLDAKAQPSYSFSGDAALVSKYIWRGSA